MFSLYAMEFVTWRLLGLVFTNQSEGYTSAHPAPLFIKCHFLFYVLKTLTAKLFIVRELCSHLYISCWNNVPVCPTMWSLQIWTFLVKRLEPGPFARSGHMVRNKLCWDANNAMELSKQRKVGMDWWEFLCFGSPLALFASQDTYPYHVTGSREGPFEVGTHMYTTRHDYVWLFAEKYCVNDRLSALNVEICLRFFGF